MSKVIVIGQDWIESERGWGCRPDGTSIHASEYARELYLAKVYEGRGDVVPDEYSRTDGEPFSVVVSREVALKLSELGSMRLGNMARATSTELANAIGMEAFLAQERGPSPSPAPVETPLQARVRENAEQMRLRPEQHKALKASRAPKGFEIGAQPVSALTKPSCACYPQPCETKHRDHALKAWPEQFSAVLDGTKTFEFRQNDRGFRVGDVLLLQEWVPPGAHKSGVIQIPKYTGRELRVQVTHMLTDGFGLPSGFAVLSIRRLP